MAVVFGKNHEVITESIGSIPACVGVRSNGMGLLSPHNDRAMSHMNHVTRDQVTMAMRFRGKNGLTSLGLAAMLMGLGSITVQAQTIAPLSQSNTSVAAMPAAQTLIFVNPAIGNNNSDGSQRSPFRTITQALQVAQPNTIILLAAGTYSVETGEAFPLVLRPGVTIQGDPGSRGRGIVIRGGGNLGSRNVAIVGANQATVTGVTIDNPNLGGYGIWLEASNVTISQNTFTASQERGISIVGNGAIVQSNEFGREQVSRSVATRTTTVVEQPASIPIATRPTQSASVTESLPRVQPAPPPPTTAPRVVRSIQPPRVQQPPSQPAFPSPSNLAARSSTPRVNAFIQQDSSSFVNSTPVGSNSNEPGAIAIPVPTPEAVVAPQRQIAPVTQPTPAESIVIPVPAPESIGRPSIPVQPVAQPVAVSRPAPSLPSAEPISIAVPAPESRPTPVAALPTPVTNPPRATAPVPRSNLLPVPDPDAPLGNIGDMPTIAVPRNPLSRVASSATYGGSRAASLGLRYRVMVEAGSESEQNQVRAIVPGAFRTIANGRAMMQVGAFADRSSADEAIRLMNSNGFQAIVQQAE